MKTKPEPGESDLRQIPPLQPGWRGSLQVFLESRRFQFAITALIVLNAITLGLETSPVIMAAFGPALLVLDSAILSVFVLEIITKLIVYGKRFHKDPWNIFDIIVVTIAVLPATGSL